MVKANNRPIARCQGRELPESEDKPEDKPEKKQENGSQKAD